MTTTKKATKRTFKAIAAKLSGYGYPESLIEVDSDGVMIYFDDQLGSHDFHSNHELAGNLIARVSEFFVGYAFTTTTNGSQFAIRKGDYRYTEEGFGDPRHY